MWEVESHTYRQALALWFYVRVRVWPVDTSGILYFLLLLQNYILRLETFLQVLESIVVVVVVVYFYVVHQ